MASRRQPPRSGSSIVPEKKKAGLFVGLAVNLRWLTFAVGPPKEAGTLADVEILESGQETIHEPSPADSSVETGSGTAGRQLPDLLRRPKNRKADALPKPRRS